MADKELFGISEQLDCSDCVNHGGDWDCDHVYCRKGTDTISRQAAIDALDEQIRQYDKALSAFDISMKDEYAVKVERASLVAFRETLEYMSSAQPGWIPCSERLPDEDYWTGANFQYSADVLMTVYNAEDEETIIDYGHTVDGSWYSDTTDCFVPSEWEVMAWMPLPKPWKGR